MNCDTFQLLPAGLSLCKIPNLAFSICTTWSVPSIILPRGDNFSPESGFFQTTWPSMNDHVLPPCMHGAESLHGVDHHFFLLCKCNELCLSMELISKFPPHMHGAVSPHGVEPSSSATDAMSCDSAWSWLGPQSLSLSLLNKLFTQDISFARQF